MFDIGLPEFAVIAIVALIVFGPDRLPQAAAQAGRLVRQLREAANIAKDEVTQAAGLDSEELNSAISDLKSLHPRNLLLDDTSQLRHQAPGPPKVEGASQAQPSAQVDPDPDWM